RDRELLSPGRLPESQNLWGEFARFFRGIRVWPAREPSRFSCFLFPFPLGVLVACCADDEAKIHAESIAVKTTRGNPIGPAGSGNYEEPPRPSARRRTRALSTDITALTRHS